MLTKVDDVIFQYVWRQSCQFKLPIDFWRAHLPSHFEEGSSITSLRCYRPSHPHGATAILQVFWFGMKA